MEEETVHVVFKYMFRSLPPFIATLIPS